jgi:serine phosphatase RsbU (regulator of sigma subunit)
VVQNGTLDLRDWPLAKPFLLPLDGHWHFYWMQTYEQFRKGQASGALLHEIPGVWTEHVDRPTQPLSKTGYGLYTLTILLPKHHPKNLAIKIPSVSTSYRLYINNVYTTQVGVVGYSEASSKPHYFPQIVNFEQTSDTLQLLFEVANYHYRKGGIWYSVYLGTQETVQNKREWTLIFDFFLLGSIFIMGIYHMGLYFIRKRSSLLPLMFALFCVSCVLRLLSVGEIVLSGLSRVSWLNIVHAEFISFYACVLFFASFAYYSFPKEFSVKALRIVISVCIVLISLTLLSGPLFFTELVAYFQLFVLAMGAYVMFVSILAITRRRKGSIAFTLGWLILFGCVVNDILYASLVVNTAETVHIGLFIFIFSQAFIISQQFAEAFFQTAKLSTELKDINTHLEQLVEQRTQALQDANQEMQKVVEELDITNEELSRNARLLTERNQDLMDSINYAKRIQTAILPTSEEIGEVFPEHFIFFKPRDLVSGDFYWFSHWPEEQKAFIAVVDCTGHGIPGAFMSLIANDLLHETINTHRVSEPAKILQELRSSLERVLQQSQTGNRDGFEIAICQIDTNLHNPHRQLLYAGAGIPLYYVEGGLLKRIAPSKVIIGGGSKFQALDMPIGQQALPVAAVEAVYLASDGYRDQFGGPDGRKMMAGKFQDILQQALKRAPSAQAQYLEECLKEWRNGEQYAQIDDILVLGLIFRRSFSVIDQFISE